MTFLYKLFDTMMPGAEVISAVCKICSRQGVVLLQDYFVYLEVCLNKEPSTLLSFTMVYLRTTVSSLSYFNNLIDRIFALLFLGSLLGVA